MNIAGVNQNAQKENNLSLLIRLILRNNELNEYSRVRLAQETGLTQAAVGKLVGQLIDWGLVSEQKSLSTNVGRRPVRLVLNGSPYRSVAVRINRDYICGAIYDISGKEYNSSYYAISSSEGTRRIMIRVVEMVEALMAGSEVPPMCIGVAVPGPFNCITGRVSMMSGFPGWDEIDIKTELEDRFSLPTYVEQDANCGALAETWFGGYSADCNMLYVVCDRGIGAGLIINGTIYRGSLGFAGEIGHSSINVFGPRCECGNVGCLELYGSTIAMQNAYVQRHLASKHPLSPISEISTQDILRMARNGDAVASEVYAQAVSYLAFGVVGIINVFNPSTVVFADKITSGGERFLPTVKSVLKKHLMKELYQSIEIKTSSFDGDPMLFGSSVVAFDHLLQSPSNYFKRDIT